MEGCKQRRIMFVYLPPLVSLAMMTTPRYQNDKEKYVQISLSLMEFFYCTTIAKTAKTLSDSRIIRLFTLMFSSISHHFSSALFRVVFCFCLFLFGHWRFSLGRQSFFIRFFAFRFIELQMSAAVVCSNQEQTKCKSIQYFRHRTANIECTDEEDEDEDEDEDERNEDEKSLAEKSTAKHFLTFVWLVRNRFRQQIVNCSIVKFVCRFTVIVVWLLSSSAFNERMRSSINSISTHRRRRKFLFWILVTLGCWRRQWRWCCEQTVIVFTTKRYRWNGVKHDNTVDNGGHDDDD